MTSTRCGGCCVLQSHANVRAWLAASVTLPITVRRQAGNGFVVTEHDPLLR